MVYQIVKDLPTFMELKGSSLCCESVPLDTDLGQLSPVHAFTGHLSKILSETYLRIHHISSRQLYRRSGLCVE
jgi:hypothetical protein